VTGGEGELCRLLHPGDLVPHQKATLQNGTIFPGTQTVTTRFGVDPFLEVTQMENCVQRQREEILILYVIYVITYLYI
jgi:hypothetical protein